MASLADRVAGELDDLIASGRQLLGWINEKDQGRFASGYQEWYTRSLSVVRQLTPDRLDDFQRQYREDKRKDVNAGNYVLDDYVRGLTVGYPARTFDTHGPAVSRFHVQLTILASGRSRLSDILANIRGLLRADLFDSEIDAARHLKQNGHLRAAGAVAGVVLEGHLRELSQKHEVKAARKKRLGIADYNDALKNASIFDIPTWRGVQRLADIRNLCDHKGDREPTVDEVAELIDGAEKASKTLN